MDDHKRYAKYWRTRAERARVNAAAVRAAASHPQNSAMRADLLAEADRCDRIAEAAERNANRASIDKNLADKGAA